MGTKAFTATQIRMLHELKEEHPVGPDEYWYFPYRQHRTGDILVEKGLIERDPMTQYGVKIGYRLTEKGRELLQKWNEE